MAPFQRFENASIEMLNERTVDVAVGAQLDLLGKIVGQPRLGFTDDLYRRYIRARIAVNRSTGKREEIIRIARLVLGDSLGDVIVRTQGDAGFILEIQNRATDDSTAQVLATMVGLAVSAGVRVIVQWNRNLLAQSFRFDVGPGWDQGHLDGGLSNGTT
jgi:hypothetical protein